jgi:hypothetical protein
VQNKRVAHLSLFPLTRDDQNKVLMLDPASGEGAKLMEKVNKLSRFSANKKQSGSAFEKQSATRYREFSPVI